MKHPLLSAPGLLGSVMLALNLQAADLGDPAAPLEISDWVKGGPIKLADGKDKTIYVVEFWATWCPPCRTSIPHLTELQKKFKDKDVVFIGVTDEKPSVVKPFVEKMGAKMDYAVAVDKAGQTSKGYMQAYGIGGIPHAFVVDKQGKVVWQGHPMDGLDSTLDQIVAGKFDMSSAKKRAAAQKKLEEFFAAVGDEAQAERADKLAAELEAMDKELGGIMNGKPFKAEDVRRQAKFAKTMQALQQAVAGGDVAKAKELVKEAEALAPAEFSVKDYIKSMEAQTAFQLYMRAAVDGDETKTAELGKKLAAADVKDPNLLNQMAWVLLTEEAIKKRDLPLAIKLAKAAYDASDRKDPRIMDTYARALYDSGKTEEALTLQRKAIDLAEAGEEQDRMKASLKEYEAKVASK